MFRSSKSTPPPPARTGRVSLSVDDQQSALYPSLPDSDEDMAYDDNNLIKLQKDLHQLLCVDMVGHLKKLHDEGLKDQTRLDKYDILAGNHQNLVALYSQAFDSDGEINLNEPEGQTEFVEQYNSTVAILKSRDELKQHAGIKRYLEYALDFLQIVSGVGIVIGGISKACGGNFWAGLNTQSETEIDRLESCSSLVTAKA